MEPVGLSRNIGSHVALYLNGDDERVSRAALIAAQFIQTLKERSRDLAELAVLTGFIDFSTESWTGASAEHIVTLASIPSVAAQQSH
jgi:hypothetical protein